MTKTIAAALMLSLAAAPALAADPAPVTAAAKGRMLVSADGARLAPVLRVADDGVQIIMEGRVVTVPAATVMMAGGKVTTSLTKGQVTALP